MNELLFLSSYFKPNLSKPELVTTVLVVTINIVVIIELNRNHYNYGFLRLDQSSF